MPEKSTTTTVARASAALPASGAYDTTPTKVDLSPYAQTLTVWATYTRGDTNGAARIKPEVSPDGVTWYRATLVDTSTIGGTAPDGVLATRALAYDLPVPAGASALLTSHTVDVRGARFFRCAAAEVGAVGTPGTLAMLTSEDAS